MMSTQRKIAHLQRILNPSQYRSNGMSNLTKENFETVMQESIRKAINDIEGPVKEKHVRRLLIGTFQAESGVFFWRRIRLLDLQSNDVHTWKFCHVLHKLLTDGHPNVISSSYDHRQDLLDAGNMWRHLEVGYGQMIYKYCSLLFNRINFLVSNQRFPNDLKVTDEQLDEIGEQDPSVFFDLSCEIFDQLDDIIRLQELVLVSDDLKTKSSMTSVRQCHLSPLVNCIRDSSHLYDYSVKILFRLHSSLPASTLEGHRDRFLCQYRALKSFYSNTSNLQYFKALIQIPKLSDSPPNFLIASDLQQHVTPKVVMIFDGADRDSPDGTEGHQSVGSEQLVNFTEDLSLDDIVSISSARPSSSQETNYSQECSKLRDQNDDLNRRIIHMETNLIELRNELEGEKTAHVGARMNLESTQKALVDHEQSRDKEMKKLREELSSYRYKLNIAKNEQENLEQECRRALNDADVTQAAMKKLAMDIGQLKAENTALKQQAISGENVNSQNNGRKVVEVDPSNLVVQELKKKIADLQVELANWDKCAIEWSRERSSLENDRNELERAKAELEKELSTRSTGINMTNTSSQTDIESCEAVVLDQSSVKFHRQYEVNSRLIQLDSTVRDLRAKLEAEKAMHQVVKEQYDKLLGKSSA